jgi:uncharacterized membrane protein
VTRRSALVRRWRRSLQHSLVAIPVGYLAAAVLLGELAPALDRGSGSPVRLHVDADTARDILGATATGMIAFTGLVVSSVLVVVQFAAAQYSPRLILWFRRDLVVKHAIGSFLAAFVYALVALRELPGEQAGESPDATVGLALVLLVGASVLFLILLQRVIDNLRPRTVYGRVARAGISAARGAYPARLEHGAAEVADDRAWAVQEPRIVRLEHHPGVVTSFQADALVAAAVAAGATIELVPGLGEFVAPGHELLRVHGDLPVDDQTLREAVDIADERTIRQDPAFAIRVIVDTAIRALSPAVNDPTTAVQALDALEVMLRELAERDLEASHARGPDGAVRLAWRAPSWNDMLDLAFDEIRFYGAASFQVARRLRAVLEDIRASTPALRHRALDDHLARLDAAVAGAHPAGSDDLLIARGTDRMGLGLSR